MDRNAELHFGSVPSIDIPRSKLTKGHDLKTSFKTGSLIPIYLDDLVPGTTIKMRMSEVVRMMTPLCPVLDNCWLDTYFYFVPHRLIWEHFKQFMGENDTAPWAQTTQYEIPQIRVPSTGWETGSLGDYLGLPVYKVGDGWTTSALPFRAYTLIWNDWFRDENLQTPAYISMGDSETQGKNYDSNTYDYVTDTESGALPLKACKIHDFFTSCLPNAQKGPSIAVPLGTSAPLMGTTNVSSATQSLIDTDLVGKELYGNKNPSGVFSLVTVDGVEDMSNHTVIGLAADLSNAIGATVNQLRQAFAVQKFYERAARGGSRYIETILSHFSVTNPDFRMQRPEYLGGKRIPINMNQVVQTDASGKASWYDSDNNKWVTDDKTPQGNTAAYSVTSDSNEDLFTWSCTEHGYIMGLAVVRTQHTYSQGVNRHHLRKNMFDFYWPELANLGEQPVLNKQIYLQGKATDDEAFGYQEAWADYRFYPDQLTGLMRPEAAESLAHWTYADDYSTLPKLDGEWIMEPEDNMERTLAVTDQDHFFGDFYFAPIYTLPMPLYSVPGLIDHH